MAEKMDMSLDDIIKMNQQSGGRGRGGRGGRGGVRPFRRRRSISGGFRGVSRGGVQRRRDFRQPAPFIRTTEVPDVWEHDMFEDDRPSRGSRPLGAQKSAKLIITNLDYGVTDQDIRELFADFGSLKHSAVHYDRSGRSLGTADVEYVSVADAIKAMKQYNNVPLDGKPMKIQFEGDNVVSDRARSMSSRLGPVNSRPSGRGQVFGRGRRFSGPRSSGGRRGGGGARGRGRGQSSALPSKEQLDAELDAYNSKMDME